ncbi:MAG: hypothetical protein RIT28_677 [Pseudomonadota bacterium]|jgi:uncharacterized repeat protein (TIGR04052 family)
MRLVHLAPLAALTLAACGDKDHEHDDSGHDDSASAETEAVTVRFEATVGDEPFSCSAQHGGLGVTGATLEAFDNRLYVHDVTLLDAQGGEHPVTLDQDGMWQVQSVALLDFEDKSGACANGTAEMNGVMSGVVSAHDTVAVRFTLGLPFELNHQDAATAPSPLNLSSLFWTWESGYKFWRFDGRTTAAPDGFFFHLGSTGCETDAEGAVTGCAAPNLVTITLDGFDPAENVVRIDLAALTAGVNLDDPMATCMSGPGMGDCAPWFAALGLPWGDDPGDPAAQTVFSVR